MTDKELADTYGVAVRAGAVTPQPEDEQTFRKRLGLPAMSDAVKGAWKQDGNARRPITLRDPSGTSAPLPAAGQEDE